MPRGSVCPACGQSLYCSVRDHYASHPQCAEAARRVPAPRSIPALFSVGALEEGVSRDLLDLRFEHGLLDSDIDRIKRCVLRWFELAADVSAYNVAAALSQPFESVRLLLHTEIFAGMESQKSEMSLARKNVPYLNPRVIYPGTEREPIVSFSMAELLARKLQHEPHFRKAVVTLSEHLKTGTKWQTASTDPVGDTLDGVAARYHPHIHRPAEEDEAADLRIPIILNADDIEVCNPLGTARNDHKQCGCQVAILALPMSERFKTHNILLPVMARASVYKAHGMSRVLAGVDRDSGKLYDEPTFASDMRALDQGVWITIPDDKRGEARGVPRGPPAVLGAREQRRLPCSSQLASLHGVGVGTRLLPRMQLQQHCADGRPAVFIYARARLARTCCGVPEMGAARLVPPPRQAPKVARSSRRVAAGAEARSGA